MARSCIFRTGISDREDKSVEVAKNEIIVREKSEALRYMEIHNIDIHIRNVYEQKAVELTVGAQGDRE